MFGLTKKIPSLLLPLLLLFGGCYKAPVEPLLTGTEADKLLIAEEKMVDVLADVHLAEGLLMNVPNAQTKDSLARVYYGQIFRHYSVDSTQFNYTMQRYMQNPELLHGLYERILQKTQVGEQAAAGGGRK